MWCLTAYKGRLYSSGADGQIKVWDLEQLARGCIQTLSGHTATVSGGIGGDVFKVSSWSLVENCYSA